MGALIITWLNLALYSLLTPHPCKHILVSQNKNKYHDYVHNTFKTQFLVPIQITCVNKFHFENMWDSCFCA
jgi:hypothetical protein